MDFKVFAILIALSFALCIASPAPQQPLQVEAASIGENKNR